MNEQGIFSRAITWLFGANWKTSAIGLVTIGSAILHGKPELIQWLPEPYKGFLWSISEYIFLAGATAFVLRAKDKTVTGGAVQQTLTGAKAEPGTQTLVDLTKEATPKP